MNALFDRLAGQHSAVWLLLTLAVYAGAVALHRRAGRAPILNPTLLATAAVGGLLALTGTSYETYLGGVDILNVLLGTAVVALAVPLHRHAHLLNGRLGALALALLAGSAASLVVVLAVAGKLGASTATLLSLAPKSATAAVSVQVSALVGGLPALTAALTILTGIVGAVVGPYILDLLKVRDAAARGLALGASAHGIGTARAFAESEVSGSVAGVATALNAPLTAIVVPLALWLMGFA